MSFTWMVYTSFIVLVISYVELFVAILADHPSRNEFAFLRSGLS